MSLDELQQQWAAQGHRIESLLRINAQLMQQQTLRPVRASLLWSRVGDLAEIVLAALCLLATAAFIRAHIAEPRFWLPAAALHLWLIAAAALAVRRFVAKASVRYDAPVLAIQRQLQESQAFALRALRVLFVSGLVVWGAPFWIVAARAWLDWDLYAGPGPKALLAVLGASLGLAGLTLALCAYLAPRLSRLPALQGFTRALAGHSLKLAQERLEKLARLGEEDSEEERA